jgi:mannosyltransferase
MPPRAAGGRLSPAALTDLIVAAVAGAASLALTPWLGKAVFPDEGVSLLSARLGWAALLARSHRLDLVLLPYYSLLHEWLRASDGIRWARLLSLLAYAATVFVVGRSGARLGGRPCGVLAAVLTAASPLLVSAALSARPYALSALTATLAATALLAWYRGGAARWVWWFAAASVATLCLQLFAVLAPLSAAVAVAVVARRRVRAEWKVLAPPLALLAAAVLGAAFLTAGQRGQLDWIPSPFAATRIANVVQGPAAGRYGIYAVALLALAAASLVVLGVAGRRGERRALLDGGGRALLDGGGPALLDGRVLVVLLAWACLPTGALLVASALRPVYVDRYVTASLPGLSLAVALLAAASLRTAPLAGAPAGLTRRAVLGTGAVALWLICALPAAQAVYHLAR